ncbi:histone-lysine N-methyltransferase SETD1B [Plectropomus leopardus]|uniref:histone-lysine N-methyltransferase SETD1B n=1 Tax=Plectropomus leopardus TaxID=160734 RepID=UPI001C4D418F|nr:histone-lysine N-methyltransferase SETD1B [Plectropomus leopardus]
MDDVDNVSCVLCRRSEETQITGPLSTKDEVTAHQNCLLYSSGLYCRNTPQFDDLFGFCVDDVLNEVKRGSRLRCNRCQIKGATAGCEVMRCKKSYHYPCAVKDRAKIIEDADKEKFVLFCSNHDPETAGNNGIPNGRSSSHTKSRTSKNHSEAEPAKVYCLTCERTEGNISPESLCNRVMLHCDKHAPSSHKKNANTRRPPGYASDSNSSSSASRSSSKRPFKSSDKQDETPSKCKFKSNRVITSDDSSNSDDIPPCSETFAPLEMDIEESESFVQEPQLNREDCESPAVSASGNRREEEAEEGNEDEDETIIHSDAESESLLTSVPHPPVSTVSTQTAAAAPADVDLVKTEGSSLEQSPLHGADEHIAGPLVPQQSSARPPSSPDHSKRGSVTGSPPCSSSPISPPPPETLHVTNHVTVPFPSSPPTAPPSDPEPSVDASSFWRRCNAAGCTQAIFSGFINEMTSISSRIQSDEASQEDYDLALTLLTASGKLAEFVAKQQEEIQRKQMELQKAAAAMEDVVSALRR